MLVRQQSIIIKMASSRLSGYLRQAQFRQFCTARAASATAPSRKKGVIFDLGGVVLPSPFRAAFGMLITPFY